tara:strand:+ start:72 stop:860 length:789 start_codon:yes stop_codon:yes gene_type:complete
MTPETILQLTDVSLTRDGKNILSGVDFEIRNNQNWVILGPNGSGKTSFLRIASMFQHPSSGSINVLGHTLGKSDMRKIKHLIGFTGHGVSELLRPDLLAEDVVMTAKFGALEPWWHTYTEEDRSKAREHMETLGIGNLIKRRFGNLSSGEKQRTILARSLMSDPKILLLDEPASGLDLPGREDLMHSLSSLISDDLAPPVVMVTHHVEEIPKGFSHVLFMKEGSCMESGTIAETLSGGNLSKCFGMNLELHTFNGRWSAQAV